MRIVTNAGTVSNVTALLEQERDGHIRGRSQRQAATKPGGYAAFLHVHFLPWAVHSTASP